MLRSAFTKLIKLWFRPDEFKAVCLMLDAAPKDYRQLDDRKPEIIDRAAKDGEKYAKQAQAYLSLLFGDC